MRLAPRPQSAGSPSSRAPSRRRSAAPRRSRAARPERRVGVPTTAPCPSGARGAAGCRSMSRQTLLAIRNSHACSADAPLEACRCRATRAPSSPAPRPRPPSPSRACGSSSPSAPCGAPPARSRWGFPASSARLHPKGGRGRNHRSGGVATRRERTRATILAGVWGVRDHRAWASRASRGAASREPVGTRARPAAGRRDLRLGPAVVHGRRNVFVDFYGEPGFPLHECVGGSSAGELPEGTRSSAGPSITWAGRVLRRAVDAIAAIERRFSDVEATVDPAPVHGAAPARPHPRCRGKRAAVIGQGSIGLLFSHALKARGAAHVTGVDRVDRDRRHGRVRRRRGVGDAAAWAEDAEAEIVVEAVGHHAGPLEAAVGRSPTERDRARLRRPRRHPLRVPVPGVLPKHATLIAGAARPGERARARLRVSPAAPARCWTPTSRTCSRCARRNARSSSPRRPPRAPQGRPNAR